MIAVRVVMRVTAQPLKRTPVVLRTDADGAETAPVLTDRSGLARFEMGPDQWESPGFRSRAISRPSGWRDHDRSVVYDRGRRPFRRRAW
jgi:hypothetical protein